jgi:glutamine synthetase
LTVGISNRSASIDGIAKKGMELEFFLFEKKNGTKPF